MAYLGLGYDNHHDDVFVGHDDNVVFGHDDDVVGHDDDVVGHDDDAIIDKAGDWVCVLRPEVGDLCGHQGHDRRWSDVDVFLAAKTHYHQGLEISLKR